MFARYPILHTSSIDEVVARIAMTGARLGVPGGARMAGRAAIDGRWLKRVSLSHLRYGFAADMALAGDAETYNLSLPMVGAIGIESRRGRALVKPGSVAVMSPGEPLAFALPAELERIVVRYATPALSRQFELISGKPVRVPLRFAPVAAGYSADLRKLRLTILSAAARLDAGDPDPDGGAFWDETESSMLTALLVLHPNDGWETLAEPGPAAGPGCVRRTIDYIHAHANRGITVEELVAVAGVSGRSLFRHFRATTGFGPMAYLRRVRLEAVRDDLARGRTANVAAAARRWGFADLGRFAGEYRRAFGENPSQTLRRAH